MAETSALDSTDWLDAAWQVFRHDGIASVRIESLARQLGVTKGSFYWHYTDRKALIDAIMQRWEQSETERMIDLANTGDTAISRLSALFGAVAAMRQERSGEVTLYAQARQEGVQDVVRRVTKRRIQYLEDTLVELGIERSEARRRATIAVSLVIGIEQLTTGTSESPPGAGPELTKTALQMMLMPE